MPSLFVALARPGPEPFSEAVNADHGDYMDGLAAVGAVILSGAVAPNDTGITALTLLRADSAEEAAELLAHEPLHDAGMVVSDIVRWDVTKGTHRSLLP
jgi:uncharacterized protein YciI